jgi:hypothetical protein
MENSTCVSVFGGTSWDICKSNGCERHNIDSSNRFSSPSILNIECCSNGETSSLFWEKINPLMLETLKKENGHVIVADLSLNGLLLNWPKNLGERPFKLVETTSGKNKVILSDCKDTPLNQVKTIWDMGVKSETSKNKKIALCVHTLGGTKLFELVSSKDNTSTTWSHIEVVENDYHINRDFSLPSLARFSSNNFSMNDYSPEKDDTKMKCGEDETESNVSVKKYPCHASIKFTNPEYPGTLSISSVHFCELVSAENIDPDKMLEQAKNVLSPEKYCKLERNLTQASQSSDPLAINRVISEGVRQTSTSTQL